MIKYSTRNFRMKIFMTIQTKFHTGCKGLPALDDATYASENLPSSSPRFRFLADIYGLQLSVKHYGESFFDQANRFDSLPASLFAASLVALKRHHDSLACKGCTSGSPHQVKTGHTHEDKKPMRARNPCFNHEHGDDKEEAACCALQRESRKSMYTELKKRGRTEAA